MPIRKNNVKRGVQRFTAERQRLAKVAATKVGFIIGARSDYYVPIDTKALINSRYVRAENTATGARVRIGYTQEYAQYLYSNTNWQPKPPGTPGKPTGGYNPNAEPFWLDRGAEESKAAQQQAVKDTFKQ